MRFLAWAKAASSAGLSVTTSSSSFLPPCSLIGRAGRKSGRLPLPSYSSNLPPLRWQQRDLTMLAAPGSSSNDDDGQHDASKPPSPPPSTFPTSTSNDDDDTATPPPAGEALTEKELKKLRKKAAKEAKREKREGKDLALKPCDLCQRDRDLLIRCQIDTSLEWKMVCGKCWKDVSGGVVDGDAAHPHYRYGGLWKAR